MCKGPNKYILNLKINKFQSKLSHDAQPLKPILFILALFNLTL